MNINYTPQYWPTDSRGALKIINCDHVTFIQGMQGWLNVRKANITIHYIDDWMERNHMIISDSKNICEGIPSVSDLKIRELGHGRNSLNG